MNKQLVLGIMVLILIIGFSLYNNSYKNVLLSPEHVLQLENSPAILSQRASDVYSNMLYGAYSKPPILIKPVSLISRQVIKNTISTGSRSSSTSYPNGVPPDYIHGTVGPQETRYYPPNWIHGTSGNGYDTYYYPPGSIHVTASDEASSYTLPPGLHVSNKQYSTQNIEPWWIHINSGQYTSLYYAPEILKHVGEAGPMQTEYVPLNWVHASQNGPFKSVYLPPEFIHVSDGGPMNSYYILPNQYSHVGNGPMATYWIPNGFVHYTIGGVATYYGSPTAMHIASGAQQTHWTCDTHDPFCPNGTLPWFPNGEGNLTIAGHD